MRFKNFYRGLVSISNAPTTLISEGTKVVGDVTFAGNLEILGSVVGNIISEQESARVRVLNGGSVQGDILSSLVEVNGFIKGNIYARDRLCLESQCEVNGSVHYSLMEMQPGAQVVGSCIYQQPQPDGRLSAQDVVDETVNIKDIRCNKQIFDKQ